MTLNVYTRHVTIKVGYLWKILFDINTEHATKSNGVAITSRLSIAISR